MTAGVMSLAEANALRTDAFVAAFGDVAEHSRWVAERASRLRPFASREAMIAAFAATIRDASDEECRSLLIAHPDLAGRAAIAGDLTAESAVEQAGVGLDRLTPDEYARFADLNERYRARFGIPFIFAVRGATKTQILQAYERRIDRDPDDEFEAAIEQVIRIVGFRLEDRISR